MANVSFDKLCRKCLTTTGVRSFYLIEVDIEEKKKNTEFEFSQVVEQWLRDDNKKCQFCNSPFLQVSNIEIDNFKLYDFDRLADECREKNGELFLWNLIKNEQGIQIKYSGKNTHDPLFIRECFTKLFLLIDSLPESKLILFHFGDLKVSFTGDYSMDFDTGESTFSPQIERFICTGLTRNEVLHCINAQLGSFKMPDLIRPL